MTGDTNATSNQAKEPHMKFVKVTTDPETGMTYIQVRPKDETAFPVMTVPLDRLMGFPMNVDHDQNGKLFGIELFPDT
jgi:uncharacterized protein YuzE